MDKGAKRGLWLLFSCQTILAGGMALSFPFFALYLHRERGVPMGVVGACLCLIMLCSALSQAIGGELSDILGRRRVMTAALWTRAAMIFALAAAIMAKASMPVLIGTHLVASFAANLFDPAARAWVSDHVPAHRRTEAYGFLRIAVNLGWAMGPAVGGFLAESSYAFMFGVTALAACLGAVLVTAYLPDGKASREDSFSLSGMLGAARDGRFMRFCVVYLALSCVMAQLVVSLSVYSTEFVGLRENQVGLLFSLNGLLVVALQTVVSRRLTSWRISRALVLGAVLYALGYSSVFFAKGFLPLLAAMAVVTLGEIVVAPGTTALAANLAPHGARGRYLGFAGLTHQLGAAMGPLSGGLGLQHLGSAAPFFWLMIGALAAAAAGGFASLGRTLKPQEEGLVPLPPEAAGMESLTKPEMGGAVT